MAEIGFKRAEFNLRLNPRGPASLVGVGRLGVPVWHGLEGVSAEVENLFVCGVRVVRGILEDDQLPRLVGKDYRTGEIVTQTATPDLVGVYQQWILGREQVQNYAYPQTEGYQAALDLIGFCKAKNITLGFDLKHEAHQVSDTLKFDLPRVYPGWQLDFTRSLLEIMPDHFLASLGGVKFGKASSATFLTVDQKLCDHRISARLFMLSLLYEVGKKVTKGIRFKIMNWRLPKSDKDSFDHLFSHSFGPKEIFSDRMANFFTFYLVGGDLLRWFISQQTSAPTKWERVYDQVKTFFEGVEFTDSE